MDSKSVRRNIPPRRVPKGARKKLYYADTVTTYCVQMTPFGPPARGVTPRRDASLSRAQYLPFPTPTTTRTREIEVAPEALAKVVPLPPNEGVGVCRVVILTSRLCTIRSYICHCTSCVSTRAFHTILKGFLRTWGRAAWSAHGLTLCYVSAPSPGARCVP